MGVRVHVCAPGDRNRYVCTWGTEAWYVWMCMHLGGHGLGVCMHFVGTWETVEGVQMSVYTHGGQGWVYTAHVHSQG